MTDSSETEEVPCGCADMDYQNHWAEDIAGNEIRVKCGCPCEKCQEY